MRRWWLPILIWTLSIVAVAVYLLLTYATGDSPFDELVAWYVGAAALVAIVAGNAIIAIILLALWVTRRRRRRATDPPYAAS